MWQSGLYRTIIATLVLLLIALPNQARHLIESDGIELRGTGRVLTYGAATCHVLEEKHDEDEYARLKGNEGQPLDLWQMDFAVYNGSGKALDHLIARYRIESPWTLCTNWSYQPGVDTGASWDGDNGHIQRTGEPYSVAVGETLTKAIRLLVFHEDEPRFARWSVDYNFAADTPAAPDAPAPTESPAAQAPARTDPPPARPAQTQPPAPPARAPGSSFRDTLRGGGEGPEMVVVPAGRFQMGCVSGEDCNDDEMPVHEVVIARPFAMSKFEVTFAQWDACVAGGGCGGHSPDDVGWGRGNRPVIYVSWDDATAYAAWLSAQSGKRYRLPSEAEWEYATRTGSTTKYHFGDSESQLCRYGNHADTSTDFDWRNETCSDGVGKRTAVVGRYEPNRFGLHDMHGNVGEWVQDCWNGGYVGTPADGRARTSGDCSQRVVRGGFWVIRPSGLRSASRYRFARTSRYFTQGFRLAQDL